jgi:hypothetical protein
MPRRNSWFAFSAGAVDAEARFQDLLAAAAWFFAQRP